ncbi:hypothetical protein KPH14_012674 [Odynerus spinipes]|uniref:Uncharacterized protein n=1 Tax=Odynerus spinipes TaxID=1348599 RepID=A0AAD9R964_9HYME|nr:hypothetical protein KPH14_012674 [Odynerus spinipes]
MYDVPYREAVGSLLFAARVSRPDIEFAVNIIKCQFLTCYESEHWQAVKRVFRYLRGTTNHGIVYGNDESQSVLKGYTDSDYAGCTETRKSTSGFVFILNNGTISWSSQRQRVGALSTTEAEYVALAKGTQEAVWLKRLCSEIGLEYPTIEMFVDNQSAIKLAGNPEFHKRTKHIDERYHYAREVSEQGDIVLKYTV